MRTVLYFDDFNRANNLDLGSEWDSGYTASDALQIVSQVVRPVTVDTNARETVNVTSSTFPPVNQWARLRLISFDFSLGQTTANLLLRAEAPANATWYEFTATGISGGGTFTSRIRRRTAGAGVTLAQENATTWAPSDELIAEAIGPTLRFYRIPSGGVETLMLEAQDSTFSFGRVGIDLSFGGGSSASNIEIDLFEAGIITPSGRIGSNLRPNAFAPGLAR